MAVDQERVAGAQHEEGGVQIEDGLRTPDIARAEEVAQHHDRELRQQHQKRQPAHDAPDPGIDPVERAGGGFEQARQP
jgi:hypothetical protein